MSEPVFRITIYLYNYKYYSDVWRYVQLLCTNYNYYIIIINLQQVSRQRYYLMKLSYDTGLLSYYSNILQPLFFRVLTSHFSIVFRLNQYIYYNSTVVQLYSKVTSLISQKHYQRLFYYTLSLFDSNTRTNCTKKQNKVKYQFYNIKCYHFQLY